jgi:hypothetical protein
VTNLDIDHTIVQATQPIEERFKLLLQREIRATSIGSLLRLRSQFDCLNDARFWFIAGRTPANPKAIDDTKTQDFDKLDNLALVGSQSSLRHFG